MSVFKTQYKNFDICFDPKVEGDKKFYVDGITVGNEGEETNMFSSDKEARAAIREYLGISTKKNDQPKLVKEKVFRVYDDSEYDTSPTRATIAYKTADGDIFIERKVTGAYGGTKIRKEKVGSYYKLLKDNEKNRKIIARLRKMDREEDRRRREWEREMNKLFKTMDKYKPTYEGV